MFCWSPLFLLTCFISGEINCQKNTAPTFRLRLCRWPPASAFLPSRYSLELLREHQPINTRLVLLTLSFLCFLAAGGFFFFGRGWMRSAAFPLAYLIFMVPMPDAMADALETASKYASAEVANLFFHLSGTPFLRAGLFFQLPNITIEVAQECSGIRSSWVLFMTSILAANLFLKTPWRRFSARRLRHSTCHFTKRISDSCDRASLRECRAANDSQPDPPPRRPPLFHAFADSIFSSVVVAAQGRRPDPTTGVALSFAVSLFFQMFLGTSSSGFRRNAWKNEFSTVCDT